MKKLYRIKRNEEFAKIIEKKHSVASAFFVLYYVDRANDNARVGISVSKKLGDAVDRNRIKRQVRQMCMNLIDYETYPKDLVIIVRKPFLENSFADNQCDLEKQLKKAII